MSLSSSSLNSLNREDRDRDIGIGRMEKRRKSVDFLRKSVDDDIRAILQRGEEFKRRRRVSVGDMNKMEV